MGYLAFDGGDDCVGKQCVTSLTWMVVDSQRVQAENVGLSSE
jgi:hypothetical protein